MRRGSPMRSVRSIAGTSAALLGASVAFAVAASPAQADTQICTQYGSTTVASKYIVMNNNWGDATTQCINVTSTGFSITTATHNLPTNGHPASYPAIYYGCHY